MTNRWITNVITQLRLLGITQKEFARLCGYSEPYMSQILRGRKSTQHARKIIEDKLLELKTGNNNSEQV